MAPSTRPTVAPCFQAGRAKAGAAISGLGPGVADGGMANVDPKLPKCWSMLWLMDFCYWIVLYNLLSSGCVVSRFCQKNWAKLQVTTCRFRGVVDEIHQLLCAKNKQELGDMLASPSEPHSARFFFRVKSESTILSFWCHRLPIWLALGWEDLEPCFRWRTSNSRNSWTVQEHKLVMSTFWYLISANLLFITPSHFVVIRYNGIYIYINHTNILYSIYIIYLFVIGLFVYVYMDTIVGQFFLFSAFTGQPSWGWDQRQPKGGWFTPHRDSWTCRCWDLWLTKKRGS